MAVSNKKFILFYFIVILLFSIRSFSSEHSNGGIYELVDFLESYEEVDFYDKQKVYEFESNLHTFSKSTNENIPMKIDKEQFEKVLINSLAKNVRKPAKPLMRAIVSLCEKHQVDPYWVSAMIWTESHFKVYAKSNVGANGLMQVMPRTFKFLKKIMVKKGIQLEVEKDDQKILRLTAGYWNHNLSSFKKILENLEVGIYYIKTLNKQFENASHATVAYNMGPTWVRRNLRNNREVASNKNIYLNKVKRHYNKIIKGQQNLDKTLAMLN